MCVWGGVYFKKVGRKRSGSSSERRWEGGGTSVNYNHRCLHNFKLHIGVVYRGM